MNLTSCWCQDITTTWHFGRWFFLQLQDESVRRAHVTWLDPSVADADNRWHHDHHRIESSMFWCGWLSRTEEFTNRNSFFFPMLFQLVKYLRKPCRERHKTSVVSNLHSSGWLFREAQEWGVTEFPHSFNPTLSKEHWSLSEALPFYSACLNTFTL